MEFFLLFGPAENSAWRNTSQNFSNFFGRWYGFFLTALLVILLVFQSISALAKDIIVEYENTDNQSVLTSVSDLSKILPGNYRVRVETDLRQQELPRNRFFGVILDPELSEETFQRKDIKQLGQNAVMWPVGAQGKASFVVPNKEIAKYNKETISSIGIEYVDILPGNPSRVGAELVFSPNDNTKGDVHLLTGETFGLIASEDINAQAEEWRGRSKTYVLKRIVNLKPDDAWHVIQDGESAVVQRRIERPAESIFSIEIVVRRGWEFRDLNFRLRDNTRYFERIVNIWEASPTIQTLDNGDTLYRVAFADAVGEKLNKVLKNFDLSELTFFFDNDQTVVIDEKPIVSVSLGKFDSISGENIQGESTEPEKRTIYLEPDASTNPEGVVRLNANIDEIDTLIGLERYKLKTVNIFAEPRSLLTQGGVQIKALGISSRKTIKVPKVATDAQGSTRAWLGDKRVATSTESHFAWTSPISEFSFASAAVRDLPSIGDLAPENFDGKDESISQACNSFELARDDLLFREAGCKRKAENSILDADIALPRSYSEAVDTLHREIAYARAFLNPAEISTLWVSEGLKSSNHQHEEGVNLGNGAGFLVYERKIPDNVSGEVFLRFVSNGLNASDFSFAEVSVLSEQDLVKRRTIRLDQSVKINIDPLSDRSIRFVARIKASSSPRALRRIAVYQHNTMTYENLLNAKTLGNSTQFLKPYLSEVDSPNRVITTSAGANKSLFFIIERGEIDQHEPLIWENHIGVPLTKIKWLELKYSLSQGFLNVAPCSLSFVVFSSSESAERNVCLAPSRKSTRILLGDLVPEDWIGRDKRIDRIVWKLDIPTVNADTASVRSGTVSTSLQSFQIVPLSSIIEGPEDKYGPNFQMTFKKVDVANTGERFSSCCPEFGGDFLVSRPLSNDPFEDVWKHRFLNVKSIRISLDRNLTQDEWMNLLGPEVKNADTGDSALKWIKRVFVLVLVGLLYLGWRRSVYQRLISRSLATLNSVPRFLAKSYKSINFSSSWIYTMPLIVLIASLSGGITAGSVSSFFVIFAFVVGLQWCLKLTLSAPLGSFDDSYPLTKRLEQIFSLFRAMLAVIAAGATAWNIGKVGLESSFIGIPLLLLALLILYPSYLNRLKSIPISIWFFAISLSVGISFFVYGSTRKYVHVTENYYISTASVLFVIAWISLGLHLQKQRKWLALTKDKGGATEFIGAGALVWLVITLASIAFLPRESSETAAVTALMLIVVAVYRLLAGKVSEKTEVKSL